eukprot:m.82484 g.82484  ORF g.82484 m.82484 type:complete len:1527 (+) comp8262_c0_seq2:687-5267(+)
MPPGTARDAAWSQCGQEAAKRRLQCCWMTQMQMYRCKRQCWAHVEVCAHPPGCRPCSAALHALCSAMGRRKASAAIKKSGAAGNSKKGNIEEVRALVAAKKAAAADKAAAAAPPAAATAATAAAAPRTRKRDAPPAAAAANAAPAAANAAPGPAAAAAAPAGAGSGDKQGGLDLFAQCPPEEPEAPRLISAGYDLSRWTGKTPQNFLFDYCRKQGMFKPNLNVSDRHGGVVCSISIGREDKKEGKPKHRRFSDKRVYASAVEARNFTAVYVLHQLCFDKPMHMLIPPGYRDYWQDLEEIRKQKAANSKHGAWSVPLDPFEDPRKIQEAAKAAKPKPKQKKKREVQTVRMSEKCREMVERAIHGIISRRNDGAKQGSSSASVQDSLVDSLVCSGFREDHVREAALYANTKPELLDWLCLHVPEGDLPPRYRPKPVELSAAKHDAASLAREYKARRLVSIGFNHDDCIAALVKCNEDELAALEHLVDQLAGLSSPTHSADEAATAHDDWVEEMESLEAIFGKSCKRTALDGGVLLKITVDCPGVPGKTHLEFYRHNNSSYPTGPALGIVRNADLPSYIILSAIAQLRHYAVEIAGDPAGYSLVHWIQENLPQIILEPPPLVSLKLHHQAPSTPRANEESAGADDSDQGRDSTREARSKGTGKGTGKGKDFAAKGQRKRAPRDALAPTPLVLDKKECAALLERERRNRQHGKVQQMIKTRQKLPAHGFREQILKAVTENQVVVVCGETGCGKTTQVPQFVLEDMIEREQGTLCNMICTQPRRLSALAVAQRVSAERGEPTGNTVGYSIRLETKRSEATQLLFCTTGILLRQMQHNPDLIGVSHVFIDEVHERSIDSDVLLALIKLVLEKRKDLKLVLMSATLDSARFSSYFRGAPVIEIPGFTHPVKDVYLDDLAALIELEAPRSRGRKANKSKTPMPALESKVAVPAAVPKKRAAQDELDDWEELLDDDAQDPGSKEVDTLATHPESEEQVKLREAAEEINYTWIAQLVQYISKTEDEGAVLIFLPGIAEIRKCINALRSLRVEETLDLLPLHSSLSADEQNAIFRHARPGHRKIIAATNIAETSITVDDVTIVIDCGRMKEMQYDSKASMSQLVETWVSKASAKQRRGRAGRVRPGVCYKMYTRHKALQLADQQIPEILRVPIEQLCLRIKAMGDIELSSFLGQLLDCPSSQSVSSALTALQDLRALTKKDEITPLGRHLAEIPTDVRIGKFLIFGCILQCLDPILTIAACLSVRSPFVAPFDKRDEANAKRKQFALAKSDLLTFVQAFNAWHKLKTQGKGAQYQFCEDNFLSFLTLSQISELRWQYYDVLVDMGFAQRMHESQLVIGGDQLNSNSQNPKILKAALCAGLYPNVVRIQHPETTYIQMEHGAIADETKSAGIKFFPREPGRVFLHPSSILFSEGKYEDLHLLYHEKVQTSKVFIRECTMVAPYPLLLFGGDVAVDHERQLVTVDKWLSFEAPARVAVLVNELRDALEEVLQHKIVDPRADIAGSVTEAMITLIKTDGF